MMEIPMVSAEVPALNAVFAALYRRSADLWRCLFMAIGVMAMAHAENVVFSLGMPSPNNGGFHPMASCNGQIWGPPYNGGYGHGPAPYFDVVWSSGGPYPDNASTMEVRDGFTPGEIRKYTLIADEDYAGGVNFSYTYHKPDGTTISVTNAHWENWKKGDVFLTIVVVGGSGGSEVIIDKTPGPNGRSESGCVPCDHPAGLSNDPVWYWNGEMQMWEDDMDTAMEGMRFRRSYSNLRDVSDSPLGPGWMDGDRPRLAQHHDPVTWQTLSFESVRFRGDAHVTFSSSGATLQPIRQSFSAMWMPPANTTVRQFMDEGGAISLFSSFDTTIPIHQRGQVTSMYNPAGIRQYGDFDANGRLTMWHRQAGLGTEEVLAFTYNETINRLIHLERRQVVNGVPTVVRAADYAYYTGTAGETGPNGSLRAVTVKDGTGSTLRRFYYTYYLAADANGWMGQLHYAIGPRNMARMVAAGKDPMIITVADSDLMAYADKAFAYDAYGRVVQQVLKTSDVDGSGTWGYAYTPRPNPPATPGSNDWMMKTVESQPDGSSNVVYTNQNGDVMLKAVVPPGSDGTKVWVRAWRFDSNWHPIWRSQPAAMQPSVPGGTVWWDDTYTDLLNFAGGNSPFVKDSAGVIDTWTYYSTTDPLSGAVQGKVQYQKLQLGETGTPIMVHAYTYTGQANH